MKTCSICHKTKPLTDFYASQSGRWCKLCKLAHGKAYKKTVQGRAVQRRAISKFYKTPKGKASWRRYINANRHKFYARQAVHRAVRLGKLKKGPCERCGTTVLVEGHHDDYRRKLDVRWMCRPCHRADHYEQKSAV